LSSSPVEKIATRSRGCTATLSIPHDRRRARSNALKVRPRSTIVVPRLTSLPGSRTQSPASGVTSISTWSPAVRADESVDKCPVCAGGDFYVRKDFDPKIGLAIVVIGASISAVFYWFKRDVIAYSILAFATLIDLVIYGRLKEVTVCYRCHSEFRGAYKRTAGAFDLHTADVLEVEYERRIGRR